MAQVGYQSDPLKKRLSKKQFIELHLKQGVSQTEIARRFNVSISSLIRLKKQYDIPTNKNIKKLQAQQRDKVSLENQTIPEEIKRLYWNDNLSLAEIGKRFNVDRTVVFGYMKRHNIQIRNKSQARKLAANGGRLSMDLYEINDKFFSRWSAKMAWVLGYIFADGNIHPQAQGTYCLSISSKDTSLLQNIKKAMKSTHPIKKVIHKEWFVYRLFITRPQINSDLSKLGLIPRKSLIILFPKVPQRFLSHFIRGVFDGDGSVFFDPRSKKSPLRVSFSSGSKAFMTALETKLHMHAGLSKKTIYEAHRVNTSYYIRYSHKDCLKFFNYIYEDADESIRLERKYQKCIVGRNGI